MSSLSSEKPREPGFISETVEPAGLTHDETGIVGSYREVLIWYRPVDDFSLDSMVELVKKRLHAHGHLATARVAKALLALYLLDPSRLRDPVGELNWLLSLITRGRLRQIYVTALPGGSFKDFSFGDFKLGLLNAESIRAETTAVGSPDFFLRYGPTLRQKWSIERLKDCRIIDHNRYAEEIPSAEETKAYPLFEEYFRSLADSFLEDFWIEFERAQELQVCFGAPFISSTVLTQLGKTQMISIFKVSAHGRGWVAPTSSVLTLQIPDLDTRIPAVLSMLARPPFKFAGFTDTEFDGFIRRVVSYIYQGNLAQLDGRYSDGCLKHVIALDLLFGDSSKATESVSHRAAVLIYQAFGVSLREATKQVAELYNVRSLYVHDGRPIAAEKAAVAQRCCVEVLRC